VGVSRLNAGGNISLNILQTDQYMIARGAAHRLWAKGPAALREAQIGGRESISDLRVKLLDESRELEAPQRISVSGTLFPCALLSSGWWERHAKVNNHQVKWHDGVQAWLFTGFDLWGPSWDFTWDVENWDKDGGRRYFIAQLGDGDEANSLPVLIPSEKAVKLREYFKDQKWGGMEAEVTGLLGNRRHFAADIDPKALELFGGLLDYCLYLDAEDPDHGVEPLVRETEVYSGYLWKCLAPKAWIEARKPCINDVYFVWEHANFVNADAVAYALEALEHKERYLTRRRGELVLMQKSSAMVPGKESWPNEEVYSLLLGKRGKI
jgi:hypothetical protein